MVCGNGVQLVGRFFQRETIAAKGFYSLFYQWSRAECAGMKRGSTGLHTLPPPKQRSLLPQRSRAVYQPSRAVGIASFFWWHPKSPITEEIHDDEISEEEPLPYPPIVEDLVAARPVSNPHSLPSISEDATTSLSKSVRHLMRHLPAPIVVLTTKNSAQYHGMTLSSFTTLSLSPEPLVSFNIRTNDSDPSRTLSALRVAQHFLVHFMDDSVEGARIADIFTRGKEDVFGKGVRDDAFGIEAVRGEVDLPKLVGKGVGRILRCEILPSGVSMDTEGSTRDGLAIQANGKGFIRVGDHVLVIARVLEILGEEPNFGKPGLSYMDGKYRRAGNPI